MSGLTAHIVRRGLDVVAAGGENGDFETARQFIAQLSHKSVALLTVTAVTMCLAIFLVG